VREAVMGVNVVTVNDVLDGHVTVDSMLRLWLV
jgi:hypothetical protein